MSRKLLLMAATAICAGLTTSPLHAQTAAAPIGAEKATGASGEQTVVIHGIRKSMQTAINIKKNAVGEVDSIAAEDLGKLPDQNVAESLQHVAGVTIDRNRGEGQFVTVRGFGPAFNAVTLNGRTLATDNVGREFSFDILPSEVISGADVYKTPQANINGASIGATVDIHTVRPLDQKPLVAAGSVSAMYDQLDKTWNPGLSAVASWHDKARNFGVSVAASYLKEDTRDDEFDVGAGTVKESSNNSYFSGRVDPSVGTFTNVDMPSDLTPAVVLTSRKRFGLTSAVQWRPTDDLSMTLDLLYSKLDEVDNAIGLSYDFSGGTLTDLVIDGNNSAQYAKFVNGTVDEIVSQTPRNTQTYQIGYNADWRHGPFDVKFDASTSLARRGGMWNSYFTTVRRTGMTLWYDRRTGSPIYDYGFSSPNYANAPTDLSHEGAHYDTWGGSDYTDSATEYRLDAKWDPGEGIAISAGLASEGRTKLITTIHQPGSVQCEYCGGAVILPASLFSATNFDFFSSYKGDIVRDWVTYSPPAMIAELQGLPGSHYTAPAFDPAASSRVHEAVTIGYLMFDQKTQIGGMPLSINTGVRIEDTNYTSAGAAQTIISAKPNGLGQNIIQLSPIVPISFSGHYTDILPSLNVRLSLTDTVVARFSASRVMTRPTLSDLSPAQTILTNPGNEQITHGNPDLKPFRASQVEGGLEWYFDRLSLLSAAVFYKDIDSFIADTTTPQLVDQVTFQVTEPTNGKGANVKGFELGYRQVFSNLPGAWNGLGFEGSFTMAESDANYANSVTGVHYGLESLSKYSYSAIGFYEKYGIQARIAWTWRDKFLQTASGRNGDPQYFDSYGQLDANLSYDVNAHTTVFIEGLNLNNEKEFVYSVTPNRTFNYRETGPRVTAGFRFRY